VDLQKLWRHLLTTTAIAATLRSFFRQQRLLKLFKRLMVQHSRCSLHVYTPRLSLSTFSLYFSVIIRVVDGQLRMYGSKVHDIDIAHQGARVVT